MEKKRILIIDDAVFMRNLIRDVVIKAGLDICGEASNAVEGVQKYKQLRPDLVTMDIVMPKMEEMDGITAVKEIMTSDPGARIIIVSALAERQLIQEALTNGAKDFIVKPFSSDKFIEVINRVLSGA